MKLPKIKKRYILALISIAYCIAKLYVMYTPSTNDDSIPDNARDAILQILSIDHTVISEAINYCTISKNSVV
jgi:hypothetical protein